MGCFLFDIDGTLIDSAPVYLPALGQALNAYGYTPSPERLQKAFGMTGWQGLSYCGVTKEQYEEVLHAWEEEAYRHLERVQIYDGIIDTLHALRDAGHQLGIVTARNRSQYTRGFAPLGLGELFDIVICSDEVPAPKPAPDAIFACLQAVGGTVEDSMFIGDSPYDMQCAHAAGVKSGLALWGCHAPEKLEADFRLAHPREILQITK